MEEMRMGGQPPHDTHMTSVEEENIEQELLEDEDA